MIADFREKRDHSLAARRSLLPLGGVLVETLFVPRCERGDAAISAQPVVKQRDEKENRQPLPISNTGSLRKRCVKDRSGN